MSEAKKSSNEKETADAESVESLIQEEAGRSLSKENRKVLLLVLVVGSFMTCANFTPMRAWITNVQTWKGYVSEMGWKADGMFCLACAASVLIGIPRLPLCAAAGLIFGFAEGLSISLLGSTVGSYGAFVMSRHGARGAVSARIENWPWLVRMLEKPSFGRVFWVRQLMVPGIVLNVLLGVTTVKHSVFLIGTLLGHLPLNITFSLVGSGLGKDSLSETLTQLLAAIGIINIIGWAVWRYLMAGKTIKKSPDKEEIKEMHSCAK